MTHTTNVILPWSHWEVYSLAFLWRRGAVFMVKENYSRFEYFVFLLVQGLLLEEPSLRKGLDRMDLDRKDR